ncbi:MmgE/PrpD family protein [Niveispirillum sp. KHB5.9]|uniref:MmgE/PrpD family protein n=1 Tax=Niveispirillum sp. KHB5.9 TaxID=3400269 RepID=UPI003A83F339
MTSRETPQLPNPATSALAGFTAATRYEHLSPATIHATKRLMLDTVGCAVAGAHTEPAEIVIDVLRDQGGKPEASLLGRAGKLPAARAAWFNCYTANVLDACDDLHYKAHIASAAIPAAYAMAERQNAPGRDLIAATAVGYDVAARVGMALKGLIIDKGELKFAPTTGYGWCGLACGAGAANLLRLDAERARNAIAVTAVSLPVPSSTQHSECSGRTMAKYAMYGVMAEGGITAALLAEKGFTGLPAILDGDKGLWRALGSLGCDFDVMTERLGERFYIEETSFKIYPACRFTNSVSDMFYAMLATHRWAPDEIERIDVGLIGPALAKHIDDPTVTTFVDGQFSMPYLLAVAAHGVPPGRHWHTAETRARADIRAFADKVFVHVEPTASRAAADDIARYGHARRLPASLRVVARGQVHEAYSEWSRGDVYTPETALSDADLEAKFRGFLYGLLPAARIEQAIDLIWNLENIPDIGTISQVLTPKDRP